jgi:hypothetical protein
MKLLQQNNFFNSPESFQKAAALLPARMEPLFELSRPSREASGESRTEGEMKLMGSLLLILTVQKYIS